MFIIMGAVCLSWLTNHIWTHTLIQKAFDVILKGRKVTNFAQVLGCSPPHCSPNRQKELFSTKAVIIFS